MKGVVPPLCGARSRDRTACEAEIPETRPGRREGVAVDRILGQILRHTVWDQLESRCSTNWRTTPTGSLLPVARSELPRLASGLALLAAHAPILRFGSSVRRVIRIRLRVTSSNTPTMRSRRGPVSSAAGWSGGREPPPPSTDAGPCGQGRKDARMPRVITVATTALGTVGLGVTRAISAQAHIAIGTPRTRRRPQLVIASSAGSNAQGIPVLSRCPEIVRNHSGPRQVWPYS
jgi:hypothetical protein